MLNILYRLPNTLKLLYVVKIYANFIPCEYKRRSLRITSEKIEKSDIFAQNFASILLLALASFLYCCTCKPLRELIFGQRLPNYIRFKEMWTTKRYLSSLIHNEHFCHGTPLIARQYEIHAALHLGCSFYWMLLSVRQEV